jgi:hypothetical protein
MSQSNYETMMKMLRIEKYKEVANYDKVISLGIDAMWKDLCDRIDDPSIDPTEIFDVEMENLKNLEYSMKLMNICCVSEMWEQDLYNFLKDKGLIEVLSNDYRTTKRIFEQHFPTCAISNYPKIEEMRALVNAIKHGEGNSLTNIRRMTADGILADSNIGEISEDGTVTKKKQIEYDGNTLTSRTLNVDGKLQTYGDAIVEFWQDVHTAEQSQSRAPEQGL